MDVRVDALSLPPAGKPDVAAVDTHLCAIPPLNQELGEPFRRDAMKKPVKVAGIKKEDMRPQKGLN